MDADARLDALQTENQRLRDELDALRNSLGLGYLPPIELRLTGKEALLLGRLLRGGVVTKNAAMDALYDASQDEPELKIIDVFICKLRGKLRPFGVAIDTRWGVGYEMSPTMRALYAELWGEPRDQAA